MTLPYKPPQSALDVLHVDADCIVLNKPSGLLSVPGRGIEKQDCLASRVQAEFADSLVVHRLDMETSGIIVFARSATAQRSLSMAFASREVSKTYIALVDGCPEPASGEIDLPLITDWPLRPRQKICHSAGKPSLTRYETLGPHAALQASRLALSPITGRSHQLRVHLMAIGHAILGDSLYASAPVATRTGRLMLHAAHIDFAHPASGQRLRIDCPAPF